MNPLTAKEAQVLDVLRASGQFLTPRAVASQSGLSNGFVQGALWRLNDCKLVKAVKCPIEMKHGNGIRTRRCWHFRAVRQ